MNISIIVVAYNEEKHISDCIDSLLQQDYDMGSFEIIVVDGMSQDRTQPIVEEYTSRWNHVRLLQNPKRTISSNRNVGCKAAKYPYVAFTDADCICPPNWLSELAASYQRLLLNGENVAAVGGGNTADKHYGAVVHAIAIAFDSFLSALGSTQTMIWKREKKVESLACLNILLDKKVVEQVGYFDESLGNLGEDWDLNFRIRKAGCHIFFTPHATVIHRMRPTIVRFMKQMYGYGFGRARLIKKDWKSLNARYSLPLLFLFIMVGSPVLHLFTNQLWTLLPILYFPFILMYSMYVSFKKHHFGSFPMVFSIFLIIHFVYSVGELIGFMRPSSQKGITS